MLTPLRHVNLYTLYYVSSDGWSRSNEPSAYEAAALPTELHRNYIQINYNETCRSAKAENLLLKDFSTVPAQGLYSNQYQQAY